MARQRLSPRAAGNRPCEEQGGSLRTPPVAFYCVADDDYFLGAAGLINSLRLLGHGEPVFLLDCGLTRAQRELLGPHVTLVEAADETPPWLLKTVAPLARPAGVMVMLDVDMVLTRSIAGLVERASHGNVVAFEDPIDRFVPEWGELLDLGTARCQPYVTSGAMCVDGELGTEVLRLLADRQSAIDWEQTYWRRNASDYPFLYGDQDVLNAILSTRVDPARIDVLEHRLAATPPFEDLRVLDESTLRCAYGDGLEPYLVHHFVVKPWLEPTHHGVYSRLLRRLLVGGDLAIRVDPAQVPLRMRTGPLALAERARLNARELFRWHVREPLRSKLGSEPREPGLAGRRRR